jgi:hypothetical protein
MRKYMRILVPPRRWDGNTYIVPEATNITDGREKVRTRRRGDKVLNRSLLDAICKRLKRDVFGGVPFGKIMATVDGSTL